MLAEAKSFNTEVELVDWSLECDTSRSGSHVYSVWTRETLRLQQSKLASELALLLEIPFYSALELLRQYKWKQSTLIESYLSSQEDCINGAGFNVDHFWKSNYQIESHERFFCEICYSPYESVSTFSLTCQHRYCLDCYQHYLLNKLSSMGNFRHLACPADKCQLVIRQDIVELLLKPEKAERYRLMQDNLFVEDSPRLAWCPFPNCGDCINCSIPKHKLKKTIPVVKCSRGHEFCFGCGLENHEPCICTIAKEWLKKLKYDSHTVNWLAVHTKECINCFATIEKNGGCNHMICKKCLYEFCWICLGPWAEHGSSYYKCNRFDEKSSVEARDILKCNRENLEKFLRYYNNYLYHQHSSIFETELFRKTNRRIQQSNLIRDFNWPKACFLIEAINLLNRTRQILKWTYAFTYYLENNNVLDIFQENQRDLELAVENLSELCEKSLISNDLVSLKQTIVDKSSYVRSRLASLLKDTSTGFRNNKWQFNFNEW